MITDHQNHDALELVIDYALGERPGAGPPPRSVCDWLVDEALEARDRGDWDAVLRAGAELVMIANGERGQRPRPRGVAPYRDVKPDNVAPPSRPKPWRPGPMREEPIVKRALEAWS